MSSIYSNSKLTIAWLGPATDGGDVALKTLGRMGHFQSSRNPDRPSRDYLRGYGPLLDKEFKNGFPADQVRALLERPYWYRVWIFQEVRLPKVVYFVCGDATVPFDLLVSAAEALYHLWYLSQDIGGPLLREMQRLLPVLSGMPSLIRAMFHDKVIKRPLANLLTRRGDGQATDKRDFVYGVLAVTNDGNDLGINANYTLDPLEIYTRVAAALICQQGRLVLLALCGGRVSRMANLPSWVPDWSYKGPAASTFYHGCFDAGGRWYHGSAAADGATLTLKGVLVGLVAKLGPSAGQSGDLSQYAAALHTFARSRCDVYTTAEGLEDAIY